PAPCFRTCQDTTNSVVSGPLFLLQVQGEFSEACEPVRSPFRAILQSLGLTFSQRAVLSLPQLSRTLIECLTKHRRERTGDNVPRFEPVSISLQNITQKRELTRFAFRIVKRRAAVCARGRNGSIESNTDEFLTNFKSRTGGEHRERLPLLP